MSDVKHIELPAEGVSLFVGSSAVMSTPASTMQDGPTPVMPAKDMPGEHALWGVDNLEPQRIAEQKGKIGIVGAVMQKKVELLVSGGLRYGKVEIDPVTGFERMKPTRDKKVQDFFKECNIGLFIQEAAADWYTYGNVFVEYWMGRGKDRVVSLAVQDANHVRLGKMNKRAEIEHAYLSDWKDDGMKRIKIAALDPYRGVVRQMQQRKEPRYILPIRILQDNRFYYGAQPWHAHLTSGWFDIVKRVPVLKKALLENLMHIKYHIKIHERYWSIKWKDWALKEEKDRVALMKAEVTAIENWLKGDGQGGAWMSSTLGGASGTEQIDLVQIVELKMTTSDGAYIEDSQEADFIIARDCGIKPSLIGISPSKSGSSPGSGSEDRVARTNHVLDGKAAQDMILAPLAHIRDMNGWDPDYEFWFANYYAATLDRTQQVDAKANSNPER